jgi:aminoglycoside phosphotransferase (APT) family kinase protein
MEIDPAELARACDAAGIGASAVRNSTVLQGGYRNTNIKVTSAGAEYVVRFYLDRSMARKEAALHALIHGTVPVPEVLYDGSDEDRNSSAFAVFRFVPGPLLEHLVGGTDERAAAEAGRSAGDVLAAIHGYTFSGSGFLDAGLIPTGAPTADAEGLFAYVHARLFRAGAADFDPAIRDKLWDILNQDSRLLDRVGPEISLVHCDFNPKNIIMHPVQGQ